MRLACRNQALADDLMQETYFRMLKRQLPEMDSAQRKAYLYKTANSVVADHYRAIKRDALSATGVDPDGIVVGADRSPSYPDELPPDMQRIFDTLNVRQQTLLWLAYVEGFKHDEIAEVMDVNSGSVRVLLSRARTELARRLDEQGLAPDSARAGAK